MPPDSRALIARITPAYSADFKLQALRRHYELLHLKMPRVRYAATWRDIFCSSIRRGLALMPRLPRAGGKIGITLTVRPPHFVQTKRRRCEI